MNHIFFKILAPALVLAGAAACSSGGPEPRAISDRKALAPVTPFNMYRAPRPTGL